MRKICFPFVGDSVGGSHRSIVLLIKALNREEFEPLVVLHKEGPLINFLHENNIDYQMLPISPLLSKNASVASVLKAISFSFPTLSRFIKEQKIDVVHTNDLRCNFVWSLPSRFMAKHVWHQRTVLSGSYIWKFIDFMTDEVICISKTVLRSYRGRKNLVIIYNPFMDYSLDKSKERKKLVEKLGVNPNMPIVGYVGRIAPEKGIEKFSELSRKIQDATLIAVGDGPLISVLDNSIHKLGFKKNIESYISALDILIAPSVKEGFGRTLVEAMLSKTFVIASNIPAHREISEEGKYAYLFKANETESLKSEILKALSSRIEVEGITEDAYQYARERFTVSKHVHEMEKIYKRLC